MLCSLDVAVSVYIPPWFNADTPASFATRSSSEVYIPPWFNADLRVRRLICTASWGLHSTLVQCGR